MNDDTIVILATSMAGLGSATYLPPRKAGNTLTDVKRWLLGRLEEKQSIPLRDPDSGEQVFLLKAALIGVRVTTIGRLEEAAEELERLAQKAEAERRREPTEEEMDDNFAEQEKRANLMDEAREVQADLKAADPRYNEDIEDDYHSPFSMESDDDDDAAPPWGQLDEKGPLA